MAGLTADTLERVIAIDPVVMIDEVDDFGMPWFHVELVAADGVTEYHGLGIADDESWELMEE